MSLTYNGAQSLIGFSERTTAPSPPADGQLVYFKGGVLYQRSADGTEQAVGSGATFNDIMVSSASTTGTPLIIQPPAGTPDDTPMLEIRNAAGTPTARILANGRIQVSGQWTGWEA